MGAAYCLTGIIPTLFIGEKMYDPQQSSVAAVAEGESIAVTIKD